MFEKLFTGFLGLIPVIFGIAFMGPVVATLLAEVGIQDIFGMGLMAPCMAFFGAWGAIAIWKGRWI